MKAFTGFTHRERTPVGVVLLIAAAVLVMWLATSAEAASPAAGGLLGALGSTVGPDRALHVEGVFGRPSRGDPSTGAIIPVAEGLRTTILPSEEPQWVQSSKVIATMRT
jgi:hypothetical protein